LNIFDQIILKRLMKSCFRPENNNLQMHPERFGKRRKQLVDDFFSGKKMNFLLLHTHVSWMIIFVKPLSTALSAPGLESVKIHMPLLLLEDMDGKSNASIRMLTFYCCLKIMCRIPLKI
jgi:hypothetical protein